MVVKHVLMQKNITTVQIGVPSTDHFKPYFYYAKHCDVFNDNTTLLYSMSIAKLNATGQCCGSELCNYLIIIHNKQGIQTQQTWSKVHSQHMSRKYYVIRPG